MFKPALALTCLSLLCVAVSPSMAQTQSRRHVAAASTITAPPLTVTKRSWLDSGNTVAVGTQNSYLAASTTLNEPVYTGYAPDRFGQSTLPGRFDLAFSNENPRQPGSGGIFFDDLP